MPPSASRQRTPKRNSSPAAGSKSGSPSMSKKRSPSDGSGRRPRPRFSSGREQMDEDLVLAVPVELQRRLVTQRLERVRRESADAEAGGRLREPRQRRHVNRRELRDLVAPDRGNARQVVVIDPPLPADRGELTARAVVARPWVRLGPLVHVPTQPPLRCTQVGVDVAGPVGLDLARAENDVDALRAAPLDRRDFVRVPRELEHRGRLRGTRELRVVRLVAPGTERRTARRCGRESPLAHATRRARRSPGRRSRPRRASPRQSPRARPRTRASSRGNSISTTSRPCARRNSR